MAIIVPSRRLELQLAREDGHRVILGVDEVGVACSAGAVVAAAVAMPLDKRPIKGVRDSKTLSAAQRERLARLILRRAIRVGVGAASVNEIDRLNIYHATVLAMRRAVTRAGAHDFVIVDGRRIRGFEEHAGPYRAVIDGDALCYAVSCASIIAKVTRDRLMRRLAARHPGYGWEHNCGYPTPDHRAGLAEHGVTAHHRRSFVTTRRVLYGEQATLPLFEETSLPELAAAPA
ncbi:MAG TPA: ribonuclease HII [Candidatus Limnocylindrales bacterium]|jgi:ribonuclease HII|nr:ribonuclease HII [Candidatus Limnocylindrales bacterium]